MSTNPNIPTNLKPPQAKQVLHIHEIHGHKREDPYFWLRNRESEAVIQYLNAENDYTQAKLAHTQPLQEQLF